MGWEKSIFVGDSHGDLVDEKAVKVLKAFMSDWKPKWRVHLGDVWDFRALRKKAEAEERAEGISHDYACGWQFLDWFKPTHLLLGNHDHRLWRVAEETCSGVLADFAGRLANEAEDELRKRKILFRPYRVGEYLQLPMGGPKLIHGFRATMYPAKAHFENWGECICGHVHKPDCHTARHIDGGKSFTVGCMGDIDKMRYADMTPAKLAWRNSFLYGAHNTKTGAWEAWEVVENEGQWVTPHKIYA